MHSHVGQENTECIFGVNFGHNHKSFVCGVTGVKVMFLPSVFFYILASVIIIFRSAADKGSSSLPHQAPSEPRESGEAKERGTGQHHSNAVSGVQGCCTGQSMWDF